MNKQQLAGLKSLLELPTAPFREHQIINYAVNILTRFRIPHFRDPFGNLVIGVASKEKYLKLLCRQSSQPVRLFVAHMDHPGFHGVKWKTDNVLQVKWHGGSPVKYLSGANMYLCDDSNQYFTGRLQKPNLVKGKWAMNTAEIRLDSGQIDRHNKPAATSLFGSFRFSKPVLLRGKRIYTNAADDLCGVYAILETAIFLARNKGKSTSHSFIGLLTRAEEVGFIGAIAHFKLGWLDKATRPVVCISLEASRTLPGAVVGKGPVVRLGDRRTVFNADYLKVLSDLAERMLKGKHQKRVMDGGACEATAATVFGLPAIGISLPLGNYHNQGLEGGPECRAPGGPAPEFVHLNDVENELKLCQSLMLPGLGWTDPWKEQKKLLVKNQNHFSKIMRKYIKK